MNKQYRGKIIAVIMSAIMIFLNTMIVSSAVEVSNDTVSTDTQSMAVSNDYFSYYNKYSSGNTALLQQLWTNCI